MRVRYLDQAVSHICTVPYSSRGFVSAHAARSSAFVLFLIFGTTSDSRSEVSEEMD
jgi:hypothetical protein